MFYVNLSENRRKVRVKGVYVNVINIYVDWSRQPHKNFSWKRCRLKLCWIYSTWCTGQSGHVNEWENLVVCRKPVLSKNVHKVIGSVFTLCSTHKVFVSRYDLMFFSSVQHAVINPPGSCSLAAHSRLRMQHSATCQHAVQDTTLHTALCTLHYAMLNNAFKGGQTMVSRLLKARLPERSGAKS